MAPALRGEGSLEAGLRRYRRRHARRLRGHAFMINDYATGRRLSAPERLIFSAATRDRRVAAAFEAFGAWQIGPARMLATCVPAALAVNARHALRRDERDPTPPRVGPGRVA